MTVSRIYPERPSRGGRAYSSMDVVALTGCTYRQLDYWTRTGRIFPIRSSYTGDYPSLEVDVIGFALELIRAGFELVKALEYARRIANGEEFELAAGLVKVAMP